ncbi:MAG: S-adenosylmethionine:tRNA ribosyltransferase-isomerase [Sphingobacteriales bacterium]|nr:MAG: S-adenosylmethionine:tRNA ribosyltransferase-isomerase [Sphingobacteriales bacterium]
MEHPRNLRIEDYTYRLPDERIATHPLEERDASKLLVYKDAAISEDQYRNIAAHIPEGALLVFNQTKVVHARLLFKKESGGTIEVFCLEPHEQYADIQTAMLQRGKVWWKCMIGGASKWKHGMVLSLQHTSPDFTLSASIIERQTGSFVLELTWDTEMTFAEVLHYAGHVPLPPYLNREAAVEDEARYQTIYAKEEGSVAAPTAGLHFTDGIMQSLQDRHINTAFLTLHVGAGTFKPVKADTMAEHEMHAEWIEIEVDTIQQLIKNLNSGIVAVGTTSLRTLESLYWIGAKLLQHIVPDFSGIAVAQWDPYEFKTDASPSHALQTIVDWLLRNEQTKLVTRTQILIAPSYQFKVIKGIVTNFHQPQSTLLLLVAAITGKDWRKIYDYALQHDFRFLSYGDGSLLWLHQ